VRAGGQRLQAWRFGGSGPAVLLVHGWGGRGGQLGAFVGPLCAAGFSVVTFDGPAHGRSTGRTSSAVQHAVAVRAVADAIGGVSGAVAHSMGAASAALALRDGWPVEALVLVAPPRSPKPWFDALADELALPEALRRDVNGRFVRNLGVGLEDLDLVKAAPALKAKALVVHDASDKEIAFRDGAAVAEQWPGAELYRTEGLGHRRILRAETVVERAVSFLRGHLGARLCACGLPASSGRPGVDPRCEQCRLESELFDPSRRLAQA
jgi:pimeloyl-ACP methyl ester carboxylesterase